MTGGGELVSTAHRTFLVAIAYMVLSALWLCASVLLLGESRRPGRCR